MALGYRGTVIRHPVLGVPRSARWPLGGPLRLTGLSGFVGLVGLGLILLTAVGARADQTLGVGDALPPVSLTDQHDVEHRIDGSLRHVLFSRDMDAGKVAKEALEEDGATLLESSGTAYVSDIARMPAIITRMFALPSMRRRDYPMLLDRDGAATAAWPAREGRATLMTLDAGRIAALESFDDPDALRAALDSAGRPPPLDERILGLETRRLRAMVAADGPGLEAILAEDLVYTHSDGRTWTRAELIDALTSGSVDYVDVDSRVEALSVIGDAAVISGRADMDVRVDGRELDVAVRYTAVYAVRDGQMRLIVYQSTALPGIPEP